MTWNLLAVTSAPSFAQLVLPDEEEEQVQVQSAPLALNDMAGITSGRAGVDVGTSGEAIGSAPEEAPSVPEDGSDVAEGVSSVEGEEVLPDRVNPVSVHYFAIFDGPGLRDMGMYQPAPTGEPDQDRPIEIRNYGTLSYAFNDKVSVGATAFFSWRPSQSQSLIAQDPFLRASYNGLINTETVNLYTDVRLHLPTTKISRANDLKMGFQTFAALTYFPRPVSRLMLGLYGSLRYNMFGSKGSGYDGVYYLAPAVNYRVSDTITFSLLFSMEASHVYGKDPFAIDNDGTGLEPGLIWELSQQLWVNPYLSIPTSGNISSASTALGFSLSWQLI